MLPAYDAQNEARLHLQSEIEGFAAETGYAIYRIRTGADGVFQGLERVERFGVHSDLTMCDYLCCHATSSDLVDRLGGGVR